MKLRWLLAFLLASVVLAVLFQAGLGLFVILLLCCFDLPFSIWFSEHVSTGRDDADDTLRVLGGFTLAGGLIYLAIGGGLYWLGELAAPAVMPVIAMAGCSTAAGMTMLFVRSKVARREESR